MTWLLFIVATLFFLLGAVCVVLVILQLPGTWIIIALAVVIELTDSLYLRDDMQPSFAWWLILACLGLAALGEVFEFFAGVLGAKKGGASGRGIWGSLIGGIIGAIALTPVLPLVGTLLGAVVGTFAGAVIGEMTGPAYAGLRSTVKPASGAAIGRILGTIAKLPIAVAVWLTLSVAAFWP